MRKHMKNPSHNDMIVFGEDWGAHPSSTQHLIKHLMHQHKVLWVNSIGLRAPRLNAHDMKRAAQKLKAMVLPPPLPSGIAQGTSFNPFVLHPKTIPLPDNYMAELFNKWSLGSDLRRALKKHHMRKPVFWTSLPTAVDVLDVLDVGPVIYYCGDDFGALSGVDHHAVLQKEKQLADRADLIFIANQDLARKFAPHKTHYIPHGVDIDLFSQPTSRPQDLPHGKRIAGFYGSLHEWIDLDLLKAIAVGRPDWNFVFIGKEHIDVSSLKSLPNVYFLGTRPHHALPAYVQHWDVSLLPFKDTPQIRACNPLKLREYLASGTPILSTEFPALDGYRDVVRVGKTPNDFCAQLSVLCFEKSIHHRKILRNKITCESWAQRAKTIEELIRSVRS